MQNECRNLNVLHRSVLIFSEKKLVLHIRFKVHCLTICKTTQRTKEKRITIFYGFLFLVHFLFFSICSDYLHTTNYFFANYLHTYAICRHQCWTLADPHAFAS